MHRLTWLATKQTPTQGQTSSQHLLAKTPSIPVRKLERKKFEFLEGSPKRFRFVTGEPERCTRSHVAHSALCSPTMAARAPTAEVPSSESSSSSSSSSSSGDGIGGNGDVNPGSHNRGRRGSILHNPSAFYLMPEAGNRDSLASVSNAFTFLKVHAYTRTLH